MQFEFFSKYFPLPKFLNPTHIGISFSDKNIKAVYFEKSGTGFDLKSKVVELESGTIVDGKIVNQKILVSKLGEIRDYFKTAFVFFTLPDELAYLFEICLPIGQGVDLTEGVAFTIEENVPLLLADTVFDFVPNKLIKLESEHQVEIVVSACVKKELEKFITTINDSGLEVLGCIHESQAIANAVISKNNYQTYCVVHARKDRVGIYLVKNNLVYFSTLRSMAVDDYSEQFLDEYQKFLEYSIRYNQNGNEPIEKIFVCGEFDFAKVVLEAIERKDQTKKIKLANVWGNLFNIEDSLPKIKYEESLNLAGPVGAVLACLI